MFYLASKLFWLIAAPGMLCLILIGGGLMLAPRRPKLGRNLAISGFVLLTLLTISPLPNILIYPLEQRFAETAKPEPGTGIKGIIMLGGFEDALVSRARGQLTVNGNAERILEGLLLACRLPDAKVIFTGGSDDQTELGGSEAVRQYLLDSGIAPDRIIIEQDSRTTYENALFLKAMLHPAEGDRYVLVTSGFHMPRSVGVFRRVGFTVIPDPVDFRTTGIDSFWTGYSVPETGLDNANYAIKEWIGLFAYRLSGRSNAFWPDP